MTPLDNDRFLGMPDAPDFFGDGSDFEGLERMVRTMRDTLDEKLTTAESPDGLIEVKVTGRGQLRELKLDPRIYRQQDAGQLAADILDTVKRAIEKAYAEVVRVAEPMLPKDLPTELADPEFDLFFQELNKLRGEPGATGRAANDGRRPDLG